MVGQIYIFNRLQDGCKFSGGVFFQLDITWTFSGNNINNCLNLLGAVLGYLQHKSESGLHKWFGLWDQEFQTARNQSKTERVFMRWKSLPFRLAKPKYLQMNIICINFDTLYPIHQTATSWHRHPLESKCINTCPLKWVISWFRKVSKFPWKKWGPNYIRVPCDSSRDLLIPQLEVTDSPF